VMIEGPDEEQIRGYAKELVQAARKDVPASAH